MQLEPYKLAASSNDLYRIPSKAGSVLLKIYRPKVPRLRYEVRKTLHRLGWQQPVEYRTCAERMQFERDSLLQWNALKFSAPRPLEPPFRVPGAHLFMQWIEGRSLGDLLQAETGSASPHFERTLTEMAARHALGIGSKDLRLFHIDAHCGNLIVAPDGLYHIDFEMGRPWESSLRHAERELMSFLMSVATTIGASAAAGWLRRVRSLYPHTEVLDLMRRNVQERSLQRWHKFRNTRKKRTAGRITVYDLVEFL